MKHCSSKLSSTQSLRLQYLTAPLGQTRTWLHWALPLFAQRPRPTRDKRVRANAAVIIPSRARSSYSHLTADADDSNTLSLIGHPQRSPTSAYILTRPGCTTWYASPVHQVRSRARVSAQPPASTHQALATFPLSASRVVRKQAISKTWKNKSRGPVFGPCSGPPICNGS